MVSAGHLCEWLIMWLIHRLSMWKHYWSRVSSCSHHSLRPCAPTESFHHQLIYSEEKTQSAWRDIDNMLNACRNDWMGKNVSYQLKKRSRVRVLLHVSSPLNREGPSHLLCIWLPQKEIFCYSKCNFKCDAKITAGCVVTAIEEKLSVYLQLCT